VGLTFAAPGRLQLSEGSIHSYALLGLKTASDAFTSQRADYLPRGQSAFAPKAFLRIGILGSVSTSLLTCCYDSSDGVNSKSGHQVSSLRILREGSRRKLVDFGDPIYGLCQPSLLLFALKRHCVIDFAKQG
jgi:hypothetical protein